MDLDMKVLVVDDFAGMRRILKNVLKQIGFRNIVEADDGLTALGGLKKKKIDIVLADWNMPKMTGLELLKAVRNDESLKNIPFVMVTAEAQKSAVLEAVQAGVSNYIVKPFTAEIIKEKLEQIFDECKSRLLAMRKSVSVCCVFSFGFQVSGFGFQVSGFGFQVSGLRNLKS